MGYATFLLYLFMSRTVLGKVMVADHAKNEVLIYLMTLIICNLLLQNTLIRTQKCNIIH